MRPLLPQPSTAPSQTDACVDRAQRVIARMQAGGRTVTNPKNWRPAQSPWS